jgi:sigma-B regulation protein RsbU (phosphoserine phosphatase)
MLAVSPSHAAQVSRIGACGRIAVSPDGRMATTRRPRPGYTGRVTQDPNPLTLRPIGRAAAALDVGPLVLEPPGPYTIGRSSEADWPITDPIVSRRHASLAYRHGQWYLIDLGSRHGTSVNGKRLGEGEHVAVRSGDLIGFGTWTCRCLSSAIQPTIATSFAEETEDESGIAAIDTTQLSGVAQRRLEAILALSSDLNTAQSERQIATAVVDAVARATSCGRVVVTRRVSDTQVETLASTKTEPPRLSRSLIEAAEHQGIVELRSTGAAPGQAYSILELNIQTAICATISAGNTPVAFLVLDTRGEESALPSDVSAFCKAVAQIAGLAFERLGAEELAARHAQLRRDLGAARRAQELLSPARTGRWGGVRYAFESLPGRVVAGDLFDIFPVDESRTALFLGDVSGKGVGAAVLMAAAQSQLRTQLRAGRQLADAVASVNRDLFQRSESGRFVTLLAAVIDERAERLEVIDAGHGMCVIWPTAGTPERLQTPNGFPLGVVEDAAYEMHRTSFAPGSLVVVFSDGAIEQPNALGEQFGYEAVLQSVGRASSPETIAAALIADVQAHAAGDLADDLTVGAVQFLLD